MSLKQEAAQQLVLASPPTGVTALYFMGYPLANWVAVGTAVLVLLQIGYLLHKWVRFATNKEDVCNSDKD